MAQDDFTPNIMRLIRWGLTRTNWGAFHLAMEHKNMQHGFLLTYLKRILFKFGEFSQNSIKNSRNFR